MQGPALPPTLSPPRPGGEGRRELPFPLAFSFPSDPLSWVRPLHGHHGCSGEGPAGGAHPESPVPWPLEKQRQGLRKILVGQLLLSFLSNVEMLLPVLVVHTGLPTTLSFPHGKGRRGENQREARDQKGRHSPDCEPGPGVSSAGSFRSRSHRGCHRADLMTRGSCQHLMGPTTPSGSRALPPSAESQGRCTRLHQLQGLG